MHRLTKAQARRIAVRAQLLDAPRPTDLLTVVQRLTLLQIDPTAAIAPSADLVAWSRLGFTYQPAHLKQAGEEDRTPFEHDALIRPMRGEVAIAGRVGGQRFWDLPGGVYPADVVVPSVEEADRIKNERRLAALGIARQKGTAMPVEPTTVGEAGEPAVVTGTKGE